MYTSFFRLFFCFSTFLSVALFAGKDETLVFDTKLLTPFHFRKMDDSFPSHHKHLPSRKGLHNLQASGSGQFTESSLLTIIKKIKKHHEVIIVDLRRESHGIMNAVAVSWHYKDNWNNIGKSIDEINKDEKKRFRAAQKAGFVDLEINGHVNNIIVAQAGTEKQLVSKNKVRYKRFAVLDDTSPSNTTVDQFLSFVKGLSKDAWLHFHCQHGLGRTTTFLAMYDMMKNAKSVSYKDIIKRQRLLGGVDLDKLPKDPHKWNVKYSKQRRAFIRNFYKYCHEQGPTFKTKWSKWCKSKKVSSK